MIAEEVGEVLPEIVDYEKGTELMQSEWIIVG